MNEMNVYKKRDGFYIKHDNNWLVSVDTKKLYKKYNTTDVKVVIREHYGCKAIMK